jgi:hypothetical protein
MIDDKVTGDLVDPALGLVPFQLATQVAMNADKDFLQDIICFGVIPYPAADEAPQTAAVLFP